MATPGWLATLLAAALVASPAAQQEPRVSLYLGPLPNRGGVITPVPDDFAKSYADLQKAHDKAHPDGIVLATEAAEADAILTVTFRGSVDAGTTIGISRMMGGGESLSSAQHDMRTLRARLTIPRTGDAVDFSGVSTADSDRTRWSTQASRIHAQAAAWLTANRDRILGARRK